MRVCATVSPFVIGLMVLYALPEAFVWTAADRGVVRAGLVRLFAFWPSVFHGQATIYPFQSLVTMITYGFLHTGPFHLLCNILALAVLGGRLYSRLGFRRFLLLYIACQVGGAIAYAMSGTRLPPMVGASGALFGLAGAWVWQWFDAKSAHVPRMTVLLDTIPVAAFLFVGNVVLGGQMAWQAHLGGFMVGVWVMAVLTGNK